jgi:magnesium transporter
MAEHGQSLSLAFMRSHPAQAARVLEALPSVEAARLFERTPARLGAAVLAAMLPHNAARCIGELDDRRALELLSPMGTQPTVAVLRHLDEPRRRALVNGLPTAAALASTLLLGYAQDTLGAYADPDVVALPSDTRAGDALERLRASPSEHAAAFVVDGERRLLGLVTLAALLRAPSAATLATLLQRPPAVLTAHAPLAGTPAHPGWEQASMLPVVEPGQRLIGALTRDALSRALRRSAPVQIAQFEDSLPTLFARAYWQALSGLVETGLALLPKVGEVAAVAEAAAQANHDR